MAAIARKHLGTAREAKPAVAAAVMGARAARGEGLARAQAEAFLAAARAGWGGQLLVWGAGRVGEEAHVGKGEGEARVAVAADVGGGLAAHRGEARCGGG